MKLLQKTFLAAVLALSLGTSSCLGPDHAYNSIKNWNATLSDKDWINEIVFLGLNIIPVYGIAWLGDVLIFNTVDYWGGDNMIDEPGPFPGFSSDD